MNKSRFCCDLFSDQVNEAGLKGFSIIPTNIYTGEYHFVLQSRNLEPDDKTGKLYIIQQVIHYCPWCGSKLSDIIDINKPEIIKIAEKNKHLVFNGF